MARQGDRGGVGDDAKRLMAQFVERLEAGDSIDFDRWCEEHAEHAGELRRLHAMWLEVSSVFDASNGPRSLSERLEQRFGAGVDPAITLEREIERLARRGPSHGRYRVLGEVGRGGMGTVLRVWDDDLRRSLAMKVSRDAPSGAGDSPRTAISSRALARFLEEAQVTGQLDHPGVVPVHELGLDRDGRVYFTMKLVQGRTFADVIGLVHAGREGWTLTRALGALHKACETMAHAHARGVIHRDLKPSNVMVSGFGAVYVMDWGLAHVAGRADAKDVRIRDVPEASDAASPLVTVDGDVLGTPAYMSPQQALGKSGEVGPQWDVYSLGAMLYHLLTGRMPFVGPGERAPARVILARLLLGPPERVQAIAPGAPEELVAICEKAMARDPSRRYASAQELADELKAWLEGRVVRAHATGAWVELRKWVARNRPLAASLASAVAIAIGGLASTSYVQARARDHEEQLNAALTARNADLGAALGEADRQRKAADAVIEYLIDLFQFADPNRRPGATPTARDVLDRGRDSIDAGLDSEPQIQARLLDTIGRCYDSLGVYDEATRLLERALELRRATTEQDPAALAEALNSLGSVYQKASRFDEAERVFGEALAIRSPDDPGNLATWGNLGLIHTVQGRYAEAERELSMSLERTRALRGGDDPDTLTALVNLGSLYLEVGRFDDAEPTIRDALERGRRVLPDGHELLQAARGSLARLHLLTGRFGEAETELQALLDALARTHGSTHPLTCTTLSHLGQLYYQQQRYADAERVFRQVLEARRQTFGESSVEVLRSRQLVAAAIVYQGREVEAEPMLREIYETDKAVLGPRQADTLAAGEMLVVCLANLRKFEAAAAISAEVIANTPPDSPDLPQRQMWHDAIRGALDAVREREGR
jgi:tetratricopeptide (TPR) repeat protein